MKHVRDWQAPTSGAIKKDYIKKDFLLDAFPRICIL
jgi:hypothetical protein